MRELDRLADGMFPPLSQKLRPVDSAAHLPVHDKDLNETNGYAVGKLYPDYARSYSVIDSPALGPILG